VTIEEEILRECEDGYTEIYLAGIQGAKE